jgi:hypothetical protein
MILVAMGWAGGVDVHAIVGKFEEVEKWRLSPDPGYRIYDPFKRAEPMARTPKAKRAPSGEEPMRVDAILDGRAFVRGRWVGPGDRVGSYRVVAVREGGIVVKEGKRSRFIPLKRSRRLLKIKETER